MFWTEAIQREGKREGEREVITEATDWLEKERLIKVYTGELGDRDKIQCVCV